LDKIILCDFPNILEREDILKLYYKKAHNDCSEPICNDVEKVIKFISEKTENFTGADLQSLIYNSFLISVKKNITKGVDAYAIIKEEDLLEAFKEFKKSVSDKDIKFFNDIKKKFAGRVNLDDSEKMKELNENDLKMTFY
jgi:SpoVK/Ycf46/Vps4 family AAA+-type ATPase